MAVGPPPLPGPPELLNRYSRFADVPARQVSRGPFAAEAFTSANFTLCNIFVSLNTTVIDLAREMFTGSPDYEDESQLHDLFETSAAPSLLGEYGGNESASNVLCGTGSWSFAGLNIEIDTTEFSEKIAGIDAKHWRLAVSVALAQPAVFHVQLRSSYPLTGQEERTTLFYTWIMNPGKTSLSPPPRSPIPTNVAKLLPLTPGALDLVEGSASAPAELLLPSSLLSLFNVEVACGLKAPLVAMTRMWVEPGSKPLAVRHDASANEYQTVKVTLYSRVMSPIRARAVLDGHLVCNVTWTSIGNPTLQPIVEQTKLAFNLVRRLFPFVGRTEIIYNTSAASGQGDAIEAALTQSGRQLASTTQMGTFPFALTISSGSIVVLHSPVDVEGEMFNSDMRVEIAGRPCEVSVIDRTQALVIPPSVSEVCGPEDKTGLTKCEKSPKYVSMRISYASSEKGVGGELQCPPHCPPHALTSSITSKPTESLGIPAGVQTSAGLGLYYTRLCLKYMTGEGCMNPTTASLCGFGVGDSCIQCPEGCFCPGGSRCFSQPGWWVPQESSTSPVPCAPPSSRCIGFDASQGRTLCGKGYRAGSRLCSACDRGWYKTDSGLCKECPDDSNAGSLVLGPILGLVGGVLGVFLIVFLIVWIASRVRGGTVVQGLMRAKDFVLSVVLTLQLLVTASRQTPPGTLKAVEDVLASLSILELDFSNVVIPPECSGSYFFLVECLIFSAALAFLSLAVTITLRVHFVDRTQRRPRLPASKHESYQLLPVKTSCGSLRSPTKNLPAVIEESDAEAFAAGNSMYTGNNHGLSIDARSQRTKDGKFASRKRSRKSRRQEHDKPTTSKELVTQPALSKLMSRVLIPTSNLSFVALSLLYPFAVKKALLVLQCVESEADGELVLASNPFILCYAADHLGIAAIAWIVLLLLGLAYPIYVLYMLRMYCRRTGFPHGHAEPREALRQWKSSHSGQSGSKSNTKKPSVSQSSLQASPFAPVEGKGVWQPTPSFLMSKAWGHFLTNDEFPAMFWTRVLRFYVLLLLSIILIFTGATEIHLPIGTRAVGTVLSVLLLLIYGVMVIVVHPFRSAMSWRRPVIVVTQVAAACSAVLKLLAFASLDTRVSESEENGWAPATDAWSVVTLVAMGAVFFTLVVAFFISTLSTAAQEERLARKQKQALTRSKLHQLKPMSQGTAAASSLSGAALVSPLAISEVQRKEKHSATSSQPRSGLSDKTARDGSPLQDAVSPVEAQRTGIEMLSDQRLNLLGKRVAEVPTSTTSSAYITLINPLWAKATPSHNDVCDAVASRTHTKAPCDADSGSSRIISVEMSESVPYPLSDETSKTGTGSSMTRGGASVTPENEAEACTNEGVEVAAPVTHLYGNLETGAENKSGHDFPWTGRQRRFLERNSRSQRPTQDVEMSTDPEEDPTRLSDLKSQVQQRLRTIRKQSSTTETAASVIQDEFGRRGITSTSIRSGWIELFDTETGSPYYFNIESGEASWVKPRYWVANVVAQFNAVEEQRVRGTTESFSNDFGV